MNRNFIIQTIYANAGAKHHKHQLHPRIPIDFHQYYRPTYKSVYDYKGRVAWHGLEGGIQAQGVVEGSEVVDQGECEDQTAKKNG